MIMALLAVAVVYGAIAQAVGISSEDRRPANERPLDLEKMRAKWKAERPGRHLMIPHPNDRR